MSERVIYLVRSWPRLSQTFIVNEVLALERRGTALSIFSLVRSGEDVVHPQVADVRAPVRYLDDRPGTGWRARLTAHLTVHLTTLRAAPRRYAGTLLFCLRNPGLAEGYGDCSVRHGFSHAVHVAAAVRRMRDEGDEAVHVHAHFAHDPALVGMLAARLAGLPFTFTGHARDLLQIPAASLAARARQARAVVTCCAENAAYIDSAVPRPLRPPVLVVYHGVELHRFRPAQGGTAGPVARLVSVGRLVEKKGFDDLLRALARLRTTGAAFECRIYGDGPRRAELLELRDVLGLRDVVELAGARSSEEIVTALRGADAFVLTPRVTADGDRDGIPNVLVEAMACALPVVTTSAGGITELVRHCENGLVTTPGDPAAVADSLAGLLADPALRRRLGRAGRRTVEEGFDVDAAARALDLLFRQGTTAEPEPAR